MFLDRVLELGNVKFCVHRFVVRYT
jgi:hypothetical protein